MEAVETPHGTKTPIIMSYRSSTVSTCDVSYRLENGRVARQESFAEVAQK